MININDIKNGMSIKYDGNLYLIMEFQHVKPGKGPAFVRTKLKNLRTGAIIDYTFNSNIKVEPAHISKEKMQFLYADGTKYIFMNNSTYEQYELDESKMEYEKKFIKENGEVELVFNDGELLGINLPDKVELKIIKSEPGIKGNTTSSAQKPATLETGYEIMVPLFINEGETVVVSTDTGKYVGRK